MVSQGVAELVACRISEYRGEGAIKLQKRIAAKYQNFGVECPNDPGDGLPAMVGHPNQVVRDLRIVTPQPVTKEATFGGTKRSQTWIFKEGIPT